MKHTTLALAISASLLASPAFSFATEKNQQDEIEKLVVVSSRVAIPLREITTSVSVITKDDIDARGFANLADVLKSQPAINATNSGGIGSPTALRVRGEEGYRTLIRLDGIEISDPTGTQIGPQVSQLQSANVSRVEILRGPQGLAYGADAGGVINIQSGGYTDNVEGSISGEFGRYDTFNLVGDVGGAYDKLEYYLAASDYKTNGFNARLNDTSLDNDGYENTTVHAKLGYQVYEDFKLSFVARNSQGDGEFDSFSGNAGEFTNSSEQSNIRINANYVVSDSTHDLSFSKTLIERESISPPFPDFSTKGNIRKVEYIGSTEFNSDNQLNYGFDWKGESITSSQQTRNNKGYHIEYQSELMDNFYLTTGIRHDDNEDFGEHTSYRLSAAYIWALGDGELKLRSAYGTGFRAPSLFEVNYNRRPEALPSAAGTQLTEEKTKGYEAALEYTTRAGSNFQLAYFDQKIDDNIFYTFDPVTFADGYIQDDGQSKSNGIELIADVKLNDEFTFNANYTYNDTTDTVGNQRSRRPKHIANVGFSYQFDKLNLSANVRLVQDFVDGVTELEDYEIFDLSARYQVNHKFQVFARIENLFDRQYQDTTAFNTAGETPHLGLKYQF
jgi:vitamin B12 transporter